MKNIAFSSLKINEAFTPPPGSIGASKVYVKKENGICPQVGLDEEFGIFWPEDRVVPMRLPEKIMKHYL